MSGKIEISRELSESEFSAFWEQNKLDLLERKIGRSDCKAIWLEARKLAAPVVERQPVAYLVEAYDDIAVRRTILSKVPFDDSNREMREWARPWLVRETPLYTSPPAPVAVDERAEFETWYLNKFCGGQARLFRCVNADQIYYFSEVQSKWDAWQARACLDKVKELNQ